MGKKKAQRRQETDLVRIYQNALNAQKRNRAHIEQRSERLHHPGRLVELPKTSSTISLQSKNAVAVFIIPVFDCMPLEYGFIFENKAKHRFAPAYFFPSGNIDTIDRDPEEAAARELKEEVGIGTRILREHRFGNLYVRDHETMLPVCIFLYARRIGNATYMIPGADQLEAHRAPKEHIEFLIRQGYLGLNHAVAWRMFKSFVNRNPRFLTNQHV